MHPAGPLQTENEKPSTLPLSLAQVLELDPLDPVPVDPVAQTLTTRPLRIGHTLLSSAFRHVEPTWRNYIMYVDMESRTGNEDMKRYLKAWQDLPLRERAGHFPEQICDLANVKPEDLIAAVSRQIWIEGNARANMIISALKPQVLARTAEYAMASPENYKHAELFSKASGLIAATSGNSRNGGGGGGFANQTNITIPMAFGGTLRTAGGAGAEGGDTGNNKLLPSFSGVDMEVIEMSRVIDRPEDVAAGDVKTMPNAYRGDIDDDPPEPDDDDDDGGEDEDDDGGEDEDDDLSTDAD